MNTYDLPKPWSQLLEVLRNSDKETTDKLRAQIFQIGLEQELSVSLVAAIDGDNHYINKWLFSKSNMPGVLVAWISPVVQDTVRRYAWMIGRVSLEMKEFRERSRLALLNLDKRDLIRVEKLPPQLLFIDPIEVSSRKIEEKMSEPDEFAIFQVGYPGRKSEVDDFHQRMVLNAKYIVDYRKMAITRAMSAMNFDGVSDEILFSKLPLFAMIHTEGHNLGHFQGPYPFDDSKKVILYEAVEEFRACLVAIRFGQFLELSDEELDILALCIFVVRFFGYGFDAYRLSVQRRETAREMAVGFMFFEELIRRKVIERGSGERLFSCKVKGIHSSFLEILGSIHDQEIHHRWEGENGLKVIARKWYQLAFPNRQFPPQAKAIYDYLVSTSGSVRRR